MQRRTNIQASSLIVLLSILTIIFQFTTYYFFDSVLIIWGVSSLISIVCCHFLQEQTSTYETCYDYALLTVFISLIITVMSYLGNVQEFMPFTGVMLGIVLINWMLPMLQCFIRYMTDYGTRMEDYTRFYRNMSILFLVFYIIGIVSIDFTMNTFPWAYPLNTGSFNIIPFGIISAQIEAYIYGEIPLIDIVAYLLSRILVFLPYGFYITLLLRSQSRLPKFFALLFLPFVIEVLQFFLLPAYCDIDDLLYALLGGIFGSLFFHLVNVFFKLCSGKAFLKRDDDHRFSSSNLHF